MTARMEIIQRALEGIENLPAERRAELLDGAAALMRGWAPAEAKAARATAQAIRNAETLQMSFPGILKRSRHAARIAPLR